MTEDLERYSQETHEAVLKRLRELASGAEPNDRDCGICNDIEENVFLMTNRSGYTYCCDIFDAMLLPENPLDYPDYVDKWAGGLGAERRALAGKMADFIERNVLC